MDGPELTLITELITKPHRMPMPEYGMLLGLQIYSLRLPLRRPDKSAALTLMVCPENPSSRLDMVHMVSLWTPLEATPKT
jgi:hypothetical protein